MWNIHGDDHSELVFKVCAQSGDLWPQRKLLWELALCAPLLDRLVNNTLVKFIPHSLDMLAQLINIVDLHIVHLLLKYRPYFIINRIQIQTVRVLAGWKLVFQLKDQLFPLHDEMACAEAKGCHFEHKLYRLVQNDCLHECFTFCKNLSGINDFTSTYL